MYGNAFARHQNGQFIPCDGCWRYQECGGRGYCYRDLCTQYNQSMGNSLAGNYLASAPSFGQLLGGNFRRDYNMLREADSDGGECD